MNKAAITKHEIYNKLIDFSEQDLSDIVKYIDFIRHKKNGNQKHYYARRHFKRPGH